MKNNFEQLLKNLYPYLFKDVEDKDILNYITLLTRDKATISHADSPIKKSEVIDGVQYIEYKNGDIRRVQYFEKNGVNFVANQHKVEKHGVITSKLTDMGKADFISTFECISIENANRDKNAPKQVVELYPNGNVFVINGPKNAVYYKVDGKNIERTEIDYEVELAKRAVFNDEKQFLGEGCDPKALDAYRAIMLYGPTELVPVDTKNRVLVPYKKGGTIVAKHSPTSSKKSGCLPWAIGAVAVGTAAAIAIGSYIAGKNAADDKDKDLDSTNPSYSDTTTPEDTKEPDNIVIPPLDSEKEEETTGTKEETTPGTEQEIQEFNIQNYLENEKKVVDIITEITSQGKEITSVYFEDEKLGDTYVFRTFADGSYDLLGLEGNNGYKVLFEGSEGVIKGDPKFDKNGMTIQMDIFTMNFNAETGEQSITDPNGNKLTYDEVTIAGIPYGAIEEYVMDNPDEYFSASN